MNTQGPQTLARTQCGNGFTCTCDVTPPKFCPQHMELPPVAEHKMQKYVVGFYFNQSRESVMLVRKNRPKWQEGKLNGIGGHVERGEHPHDAMVREFMEETDVKTNPKDWRHFATMNGVGYQVFFYETHGEIPLFKVATDEDINIYGVDKLLSGVYPIIPNLLWLLPLACDKDRVRAEIHDPSVPVFV